MLSADLWEKFYHFVTGAVTVWATIWGVRSYLRHRLKLKATAIFDSFSIPQNLVEELRSSQGKLRQMEFDILRQQDLSAMTSKMLDQLNKPHEFDLFDIREIWKIDIENRSRLEIKDIKFSIETTGLFSTDRPDQSGDAKAFDRNIAIGTMQYGDKETLTLWTKNTYQSQRDSVRLTFATGFVMVDTGKRYFGGAKKLAGMYEAAGLVVGLLITSLVVNVLCQLGSMGINFYIKTYPASTQPTTKRVSPSVRDIGPARFVASRSKSIRICNVSARSSLH